MVYINGRPVTDKQLAAAYKRHDELQVKQAKKWARFFGNDPTIRRLANAGNQFAGWMASDKFSVSVESSDGIVRRYRHR